MTSRILSLLQLGDVHLPDYRRKSSVDLKDKGFPSQLTDFIAPQRLEQVVKYIVTLLNRKDHPALDAILMGGDLTSRGNLTEYQNCVAYLSDAFQITKGGRWSNDQIHVVPGNHDIDRSAIDPKAGIFEKFTNLEKVWQDMGLPVFAAKESRHTYIQKDQKRFDLFSLNSCLGCGQKDYLPEKIRDKMYELLKDSTEELQTVQLDTPAFDHAAINSVTQEIESLNEETLPIVLGHHNILPQEQPRIEMYTEAINGGLIRSRLSKLQRPVIYCHGHLHKDPVEIVQCAKVDSGRLVCVSAPLLADGFNIIDIHYSRASIPIGCVIRPYRFNDDGAVRQESTIRIPLWGQRDCIRIATDEAQTPIIDAIKSEPKRFNTLKTEIQTSEDSSQETLLESILLELEWAGIVTIANREAKTFLWQISRRES